MSQPSSAQDFDQAFQRLRALIGQVRPYLPGDLCGELVMAMFDFCDAEIARHRRDRALTFSGRGPEPEAAEEEDSDGVSV